MRDPKRIEKVLNEIKEILERYPDLRLGQLIVNGVPESMMYHVEDVTLVEALKVFYKVV